MEVQHVRPKASAFMSGVFMVFVFFIISSDAYGRFGLLKCPDSSRAGASTNKFKLTAAEQNQTANKLTTLLARHGREAENYFYLYSGGT